MHIEHYISDTPLKVKLTSQEYKALIKSISLADLMLVGDEDTYLMVKEIMGKFIKKLINRQPAKKYLLTFKPHEMAAFRRFMDPNLMILSTYEQTLIQKILNHINQKLS